MSDFEDWTRDFGEFLEGAIRVTEQWAEQTLQAAMETADTLADEIEKQIGPTLEEWADELHQAVAPLEATLDEEVERFSADFSAFVTPLIMPLTEAVDNWFGTVATPFNNTIDPMVNEHVTCIGCRHYYGQTHGGNLLICAMHPYGPDQERCPDWESVWGQPPNIG